MRSIYAIGESLLDIIYKEGRVLAKKVGGSMLNTSISLGRLKLPIYLISEFGDDVNGDIIANFLETNDISLSFVSRYSNGNTAIANAHLDKNNNASYTFSKNYPKERLKIGFPDFKKDDFLLFGSFFSVDKKIRHTIEILLKNAKKSNVIMIYDPNMRSKIPKTDTWKTKYINNNLNYADVIRASHEDFQNIYGVNNFKDASNTISLQKEKVLIYTCAERGVYLRTPLFDEFYKTPKLNTISSIGAGDSFNAGLIHAFYIKNIARQNLLSLNKKDWGFIISHAILFANNVCQSYENYISNTFAESILKE